MTEKQTETTNGIKERLREIILKCRAARKKIEMEDFAGSRKEFLMARQMYNNFIEAVTPRMPAVVSDSELMFYCNAAEDIDAYCRQIENTLDATGSYLTEGRVN